MEVIGPSSSAGYIEYIFEFISPDISFIASDVLDYILFCRVQSFRAVPHRIQGTSHFSPYIHPGHCWEIGIVIQEAHCVEMNGCLRRDQLGFPSNNEFCGQYVLHAFSQEPTPWTGLFRIQFNSVTDGLSRSHPFLAFRKLFESRPRNRVCFWSPGWNL